MRHNNPTHYIIDADPPPCVDCKYHDLCAEEELACEVFRFYVNRTGLRGRQPSQIPTREMFERIYAGAEDNE